MIRNIIFDWCGTLVDDLEAVWRATNKTFEKSGVSPLSLERFRREFELPFRPFYQRHTPHISEAQLEAWFLEALHQEQDAIAPLAHSQDFLEFCRRQGIAMFILSSIHEDHFARHLEITGFDGYFRQAYIGVRDKRNKIEEVLKAHGLKLSETLFVGDMQHDIDAAKCGAVRSCGVLTGFNTFEQLQEREPDLIVEHLGELQRLLQSHRGFLPPRFAEAQFPVSTVGALIFDPSGRLLLVQTRKWSNKWGIPGGKIRFGETAEAALRREVLEETNLSIENIRLVLVQDAIRPPEFCRPAHFLLLNYTCRAVPPLEPRLNHEAQAFQWVALQEARAMDINAPTRQLIAAAERQNFPKTVPAVPALGEPSRDFSEADKIIIDDLEVHFRIGVPYEERARPQRLCLSVAIECPLQTAAQSDDLAQTIDYGTLATELAAFGEGKEWKLLERLANDLALWILRRSNAKRVTVEVKKFILPNARHIAVRLTRPHRPFTAVHSEGLLEQKTQLLPRQAV